MYILYSTCFWRRYGFHADPWSIRPEICIFVSAASLTEHIILISSYIVNSLHYKRTSTLMLMAIYELMLWTHFDLFELILCDIWVLCDVLFASCVIILFPSNFRRLPKRRRRQSGHSPTASPTNLAIRNCWGGTSSAGAIWKPRSKTGGLFAEKEGMHRPFGRGTTLLRGLTITMVINHLLKKRGWNKPFSVRPFGRGPTTLIT